MTLNTQIYILDRIDHREVFVKCNQLIGSHEGIEFTDEPVPTWRAGKRLRGPDDGDWFIWNKPDQGLCALMDVHYRKDAPLRAPGSHAMYCDGGKDECFTPCGVACWLEVSFDTAYGYRGDKGEDCGGLHARLVAELGQWLDSKDIRWKWKNEFTGEVHDRYDGLTDLTSGGAEATDWFRNIVSPAIGLPAAGGES